MSIEQCRRAIKALVRRAECVDTVPTMAEVGEALDRLQAEVAKVVGPKPASALYVPKYGDRIEHAIVRGLIAALGDAGFVPVAVWDSEHYVVAGDKTVSVKAAGGWKPSAALSVSEVMDAIFAVDAAVTLHFAPRGKLNEWGAFGVMLVQGNKEDMLSYYHVREDVPEWSKAIEEFSKDVGDGVLVVHRHPKR